MENNNNLENQSIHPTSPTTTTEKKKFDIKELKNIKVNENDYFTEKDLISHSIKANDRKYFKKIDLKSLEAKRNFIEKLDLPLLKPGKYGFRFLAFSTLAFCGYMFIISSFERKLKNYEEIKKGILKEIRTNPNLRQKLMNSQINNISDYTNMTKYLKMEA